MILKFPDLDSLLLCLGSGLIPEEISVQQATFAVDGAGEQWLEFLTPLPRGVLQELRELGVKSLRSWKGCSSENRVITHWWEAIPVQACNRLLVAEKQQVLFEIQEESQLTELVHEILRQGNDRQSVRYLSDEANRDTRALLKVVGPPYYTLLRAVHEHDPDEDALRAYVEKASRLWVEVGFEHPCQQQFVPAPDQHVLINRSSQWQYISVAPFRDLYSRIDVQLPGGTQTFSPVEVDSKLEVPLQLLRGTVADELPVMWVLKADGMRALEGFVQHSSDALLERLSFAVAMCGEESRVLIRIRPSRLQAPALPFDGIGMSYRNMLRINNLFVPTGYKLHPPLRRDAIRNTLAADENRVVWLEPAGNSSFESYNVSERDFQPLTEWVSYVLDQDQVTLSAWVKSSNFQFDEFVCKDSLPDIPKNLPRKAGSEPQHESTRVRQQKQINESQRQSNASVKVADVSGGGRDDALGNQRADVNVQQLELELKQLEQDFRSLDAPLDSEVRIESWEELAVLNDALKRYGEAATCRVHRLWEEHEPEPAMLRSWLQTIIRSAGRKNAITNADHRITDEQIEELLKKSSPLPVETAQLAAYIVWQAETDHPSQFLQNQRSSVQRFIEQNEHSLPVRTAWLTWLALARLAGGDTLLLARSRDRILERLYQHGLAPDLEVPSFLRTAGSETAERFRHVKDRFVALHEIVQGWSKNNLGLASHTTHAYIDLIYAYGLARLGEVAKAQELLDIASKELSGKRRDDVHRWLRLAYRQRIREAVDGVSNAKLLGDDLLEYLEQMSKVDRYKVDRLRQHSSILEPHEQMDPYRSWGVGAAEDLGREVATLFDVTHPGKLLKLIKSLFTKTKTADEQTLVLTTALELSPRLGEKQAMAWLTRVDGALESVQDPVLKAGLLERSMSIAAHYGQTIEAARLFERLRELIASQKKAKIDVLKAFTSLLSQSFRVLRRLGMRDELAQLQEDLAVLVSSSGRNDPNELEHLKLSLQLASGWFYFGSDKSWGTIDRVRELLLKESFLQEGHVGAMKQSALTMAYIAAVGQAPLQHSMSRFEDLFQHLKGIHDSNSVNSHYSLKQLDIVEALIRTVVSDDFTVDKSTLRWLDEEEYLIRRRIHRDMQTAMNEGSA